MLCWGGAVRESVKGDAFGSLTQRLRWSLSLGHGVTCSLGKSPEIGRRPV